MFESSVITARSSRWGLLLSFTLESGLAAALLAWSILHMETLRFTPPSPPLFYTRPRHVELVSASGLRSQPFRASALTFPTKVFSLPGKASPVDPGASFMPDAMDSGPALPSEFLAGAGPGTPGYFPGTRYLQPPSPPAGSPGMAASSGPVRRGGEVMEAMVIRRILPVYPEMAKRMRVSGAVHLVGTISREGKIERLQVISGHPLLVQAALEAVSQWLYRPTLLNGQPVEVIAPIEVSFSLSGSSH